VNLALDVHAARRQAEAQTWNLLGSLGVPICLRATPDHRTLVTRILGRHPDVRFVVDHLGLPERGETGPAITRLTEVAQFDNCLLKVAGLWRLSALCSPYEDTWPILAAALDAFTSERLVWGSDFPAAAA